jgi:hypothetical protein
VIGEVMLPHEGLVLGAQLAVAGEMNAPLQSPPVTPCPGFG